LIDQKGFADSGYLICVPAKQMSRVYSLNSFR
jgi:hypothetical protein